MSARPAALLLVTILAGCTTTGADSGPAAGVGGAGGDGAAGSGGVGGALADCPAGQDDRVCRPEAPRPPAAEDCPAGVSPEGPCAPQPPAAPAPPALADWLCADGFVPAPIFDAVPEGLVQVSACTAPAPPRCAPGTIAHVGEAACAPHGSPCPGGDGWAAEGELLARAAGFAGQVRYARAGSAAGGDGSRAAPFATAGEALAAAQPGDVVALAEGSYSEELVVDREVALLGACVTGTVVDAPAGAADAVVLELRGAGARLVADLGITGPRRGLRVEAAPGSVVLRGLRVSGVIGRAIELTTGAAAVRGEELAIADVALRPGGGAYGFFVEFGTQVDLHEVSVERVQFSGLGAFDPGTRLAVDGLVALDCEPRANGDGGFGLLATGGALLEASRVVVDRSVNASVYVDSQGVAAGATPSVLHLTDALLSNTRPGPEANAQAVFAIAGGEARIERVLATGFASAAIGASGAGSRIVAADLCVKDPAPGAAPAAGLLLTEGASASVDRAAFVRVRETGISASSSTLEARDLVVLDTAELPGSGFGWGGGVAGSGSLRLERALLAGSAELGLLVGAIPLAPEPATAELVDVRIRGVHGATGGADGRGLLVQNGATTTVTRLAVEEARTGGIHVGLSEGAAAALLTGTDVEVGGVAPEALSGREGTGLYVAPGASVSLTRVALHDLHLLGAWAVSSDGKPPPTLSLTDLSISDVGLDGLELAGRGLELHAGTVASCHRCRIERVVDAGLVAFGATVDLQDVVITGVAALPTGRTAAGLAAVEGARVEARRLAIDGVVGGGILGAGASTVLQLSDVVLRAVTVTPGFAGLGRGLELDGGAELSLDRALLSDVEQAGIVLNTGVSATLRDVAVDTVLSAAEARNTAGLGLQALAGCHLVGERLAVHAARSGGVVLVNAEAELTDLSVSEITNASCTVCDSSVALVVTGGAARLERFRLVDNVFVGMYVNHAPAFSGAHGLISRNEIGLALGEDAGLSLDRDFVEVLAFGNVVDVDARDLPIPEAPAALQPPEQEEKP